MSSINDIFYIRLILKVMFEVLTYNAEALIQRVITIGSASNADTSLNGYTDVEQAVVVLFQYRSDSELVELYGGLKLTVDVESRLRLVVWIGHCFVQKYLKYIKMSLSFQCCLPGLQKFRS